MFKKKKLHKKSCLIFISLHKVNISAQYFLMKFLKFLLLFSVIYLSLQSVNAQGTSQNIPSIATDSSFVATDSYLLNSVADSIVNYGKLFLNTPYRYGSKGAESFDCSGFTSYVYRNFGYKLNHSSSDQAQQFDTINRERIKKGDLVFFSGRRHSKSIGHVGIVVAANENGEFDFIHAAVRTGVVISNSQEDYYKKRFVSAGRVLKDTQQVMTAISTRVAAPALVKPEVVKPTQKIIPAQFHTVKSGETLSGIAEKYGISVSELKKKNKLDGSKITLKQRLKIKSEETILIGEPQKELAVKQKDVEITAVKLSAGKEMAVSKDVATETHLVSKGETLTSIAKKYNVTVDALKEINQLQSGKILLGQELKLTKSVDPTEVAVVTTKQQSLSSAKTIVKSIPTKKYIVQSGDNLIAIAKSNNITLDELKQLNNLQTTNIHAGQELVVSGSLSEAVVSTEGVVKRQTIGEKEVTDAKTYKVKSGDNLTAIAAQAHVPVSKLRELNQLSSNKIKVGDVLVVPEETVEVAKTEKSTIRTNDIIHKVKSGESYYSIAKKYHCTMAELKGWNNKTSDQVNIGDNLTIHQSLN